MSGQPVLAVDNLQTHFFTQDGITRAVDGVGFAHPVRIPDRAARRFVEPSVL